MPSIEPKSIDRIKPGDRLLTDAGVFAKAGTPIDERTIRLLARHKITYVPTVSLTYEEQDREDFTEEKIQEYLAKSIASSRGRFAADRERLTEKLKSIYVPFHEDEKIFHESGKKKQLTGGVLLEKEPGPLYQPDIDAGSLALLSQNDVRYLHELVTGVYNALSKLTRIAPDTRGQKNRIPRGHSPSIRLHSAYDGERLSTLGDAFVHHAVDTAILYLVTLVNINKKRITEGCPLSADRFDPDKGYDETSKFQYREDLIIESTLGILLHALGWFQSDIHKLVSSKPLLSRKDQRGIKQVRLLQRNIYVVRNLLRNRHDISSLSRMMVALQRDYPDGTGFPPPNTNRFHHEFVRLFQIASFYDEMTNPVTGKVPYSRMDVIGYMRGNSGPYAYSREEFSPSPRFDSELLEEFVSVLAPYSVGEKVYLFEKGSRNAPAFVGRVYSYLDSWIPLISVLKDERRIKIYKYGQMLFYLPTSDVLIMSKGKVSKRSRVEWVKDLEIVDASISPGTIGEYADLLYGSERPLSRQLRGG
ncbi:MAG: hypothetical protein ACLFRY_06985 [Spirochaetia bacterium]